MQQTIMCPKCGTQNPANKKICSTCKSELANLLATTATFIKAPEKLGEGPQIELDNKLHEGERAVLLVKKGPILGQRLRLKEGETLIGRDPKSDIFLNDITVSRRHAKITLKNSEAFAKDLGSLNGTYLNSNRFKESKLSNQDELQIGKFLLVYICE
ncbi:MAG: FHA domain-containing protein [Actinobacteria bacterium]|nr:MAG: FHA domain-containing protein [Actinomycetota bacterium]